MLATQIHTFKFYPGANVRCTSSVLCVHNVELHYLDPIATCIPCLAGIGLSIPVISVYLIQYNHTIFAFQVAVGRNMSLTALVSGTVRITTEAFVPKPESDLGKAVIKMPIGSVLYKPTINIVKEREIGMFKLKEQI